MIQVKSGTGRREAMIIEAKSKVFGGYRA